MRSKSQRRKRHKPKPKEGKRQQGNTSKMTFARKIEIGLAVAGFLITSAALLLTLATHLRVSLETPLDPNDVMSTPVELRVDGPLDVEDVRVAVMMSDFASGNGNITGGRAATETVDITNEIKSGETKTFPALFMTLFRTGTPIVKGTFVVIVSFRYAYIPWRAQPLAFVFRATEQSDGSARLEPQPAEKTAREYEEFMKQYSAKPQ